METKDLIANLREWHENLISELCAEDVLTCDDLCGYPGPCIVIQASDLLEAQQKRIAELESAVLEQEERRWIPVTERLPKCGERVLATDGGFVGEFYINKRGQWQRYNVNDSSLLMALDILFWMPLPEPPKEDA